MMFWIWVLVPLAAIFTAFILNFQKNQLELSKSNKFNEDRVEELENELQRLTRRIENLETIAASEPDEFKNSELDVSPPLNDMEEEKKINQDMVNRIAQKRRARS